MMSADRFEADRAASWSELDAALRQARDKPERLGAAGVRRLGELYRAAAADLAFARRRFPGDPLLGRLEPLVLRALPADAKGGLTSSSTRPRAVRWPGGRAASAGAARRASRRLHRLLHVQQAARRSAAGT